MIVRLNGISDNGIPDDGRNTSVNYFAARAAEDPFPDQSLLDPLDEDQHEDIRCAVNMVADNATASGLFPEHTRTLRNILLAMLPGAPGRPSPGGSATPHGDPNGGGWERNGPTARKPQGAAYDPEGVKARAGTTANFSGLAAATIGDPRSVRRRGSLLLRKSSNDEKGESSGRPSAAEME